jgi:hypothetical protein
VPALSRRNTVKSAGGSWNIGGVGTDRVLPGRRRAGGLFSRHRRQVDHLYRERLLRDRYGLDFTTVDAPDAVGDGLDITEIIDAEIVGDDPSPAANNHEADEDTT